MRYRVDELAAQCGVSVDTVRFYQAKGLLQPGQREGRVSWYSKEQPPGPQGEGFLAGDHPPAAGR